MVVPIAIVMIVAAVATILLVLGGDEGPNPNPSAPGGARRPGAGLNGTFTASFGAPTQPNGQPFQDASGGSETWVIKSACDGGKCVASATKVNGSLTTATALVLDEVDGRWESVTAKEGTCQEPARPRSGSRCRCSRGPTGRWKAS